jgi:hypothetical protein
MGASDDERKSKLPTIVSGRVIWHLGYTKEASAAAFTQSYQEFQRAAFQHEPSYRVRGVLTDGFDRPYQLVEWLVSGSPGMPYSVHEHTIHQPL